MIETMMIRFFVVGISLIILSIFIYKLYQSRSETSKSIIWKVIASFTLLIFHPLAKTIPQLPFAIYLVAVVSQYYSIIFSYLAAEQMIYDRPYQPVIRHTIFRQTTIASFVIVSLFYFNRNNLGSFSDSEAFRPTAIYYMSYIGNYSMYVWLLGKTILMIMQSTARRRDLFYRIRQYTFVLSIFSLWIGTLLITLNLVLSWWFGITYQGLNEAYHLSKLPFVLLFLLGIVIHTILIKGVKLVGIYTARQKQHNQELLAYLHGKLVQVAPVIQLEGVDLSFDDMLTEIEDAHEHILSHVDHPLSPYDTAKHLANLLRNKTVIEKPGPYFPALPRNAVRYNARLAKNLMRLEGQQ